MKILIFGGAGFIGSNLCRDLLLKKHTIYCVDNLCTSKKSNISELLNNDDFNFIPADVSELSFNFNTHVDIVFNLASPASPIHYQRDPIFTAKTGFIGTLQALEIARRNNATMLQASTSEVYGDPIVHPQSESYWGNVNPIGIRSCYDESKRCAETLCYDYIRKYNTNVKIVRIFNTYGPFLYENDGRVVSNFIIQALKNEPITIYGDGKQTRSFQYIDDLINGMLLFINSEHHGPINIGNPGEFTIIELAEKIVKLTNSKSTLIYKDLPKDDPKQRKPDITLAKKLLNWEPKIDLNNGLIKTIDYFKKVI